MAVTVGSTSTPTSGILTAAGVGSGLDVNGLVSQLVAAKRAPQQSAIDSQKASAQTQLSALGQVTAALSALQSSLSSLNDGSAFTVRKTSVGDSTLLSASASSTATTGNYSVNVTQLATALKASSGAFASDTANLGTGTLTISVGSQQMSLSIDSTNSSLASIRDAINNASNNPGVSATIVTGTDGAHLSISSTQTGTANVFKVTSSGGDGGLAALNYDPNATTGNKLSVVTAAKDATYTIDGLAGSSSQNTVTTAIDGVTLNLTAVGTTTVTVANDTTAATTAIGNFVNTYNSFVGIYNSLTQYDPTSGTAGALIGDATLNGIQSTFSKLVGGAVNGNTLASVGISLQVDGTLQLDSGKLATAMSGGGGTVKAFFSGTGGFAAQFGTPLDGWIGSSGILGTRTSNINQQLSDLANQQTALDASMAALTARYQAQFNALDAMLAKLNSTSSYLTQQFDALNGSSKK
ncbi:MAG TPA: flagellar filament capping protein FliD [Frateuria sp.]|uniref:flagellar filament capping protein FliD n=1 Tax=Frateuria sp. TaxID=2211372 RepID=UPI002DEFBB5B|nr:flagellar filament capping protein FliD [Frateuria sp.]